MKVSSRKLMGKARMLTRLETPYTTPPNGANPHQEGSSRAELGQAKPLLAP